MSDGTRHPVPPRHGECVTAPSTASCHRPLRERRQRHLRRRHQPIHAGEPWHLDHTDARDGYLGVSHAYCNLRQDANKTNGRRPPDEFVERPYR